MVSRINRILFATDFSPAAANALEHAALIAATNDAELHVLHVRVRHPENDDRVARPFPERDRYHQVLERLAANDLHSVAPRLGVRTFKRLVHGADAAAAIVEYVYEHAIDLLVMGTHGHTSSSRLLLGSVVQKALRMSPVSVLLVGKRASHRLTKPGYGTIMTAVDFSHASREALRQGVAWCRQHHARLVAVHVLERAPHPAYFASRAQPAVQAFAQLVKRARHALEDWVISADLEGLPSECVIADGRIHKKLVDLADERGADVLVMGTVGLSGADRFLLGSVTERVLRLSPCPVLVAKSREPARI